MHNLSIPPMALTTLAQWRAQYERLLKHIAELHQAGTIDVLVFKEVTDYIDKLNQAFKYYFSLKTLQKQIEKLQSLLDELQIFAGAQKDSPILSELLAELKTILIATQEELLVPMEIEKLPPEILHHIAADNFTSRQALNLAQCSPLLFFGDAGLSFLAKRKRLFELGKFKLTTGGNASFLFIQNKLFVWGKNTAAQLGLGDNDARNVPVEFDLTRLQLAPEDGVTQIMAGFFHTILLTQQGRCFAWGCNVFGQLGLGDDDERNEPAELHLTRLGLAPEDGVAQVIAGGNHTILLTRQRRCFVWGNNDEGQLGLGDNDDRNEPTELHLPRLGLAPEDGVAQVIVGGNHTILLTLQGRCFVWGSNTYGQLGLGDDVHRNIPMELNLASLQLAPDDVVAQVIAGVHYTILLTRQGRCFAWGRNSYAQLGLGDTVDRNRPAEFHFAPLGLATGDGVAQIVAGRHQAILLTQHGRCFGWGRNTPPNLPNREVPQEFALPPLQLAQGDGIAQVIVGDDNTIVLTRQGRCFVWGNNSKGQLGLGFNCESISRPTETFYSHPHLKELKNLWSSLQKEDLATLASLACDKAMDGQTAYQMIVQRLVSENIKTRLLMLPLIHTAPWHQLALVKKLVPFPSLYEPFVETVKNKSSKEQQSITHALLKLMHIYDYFIDKDASSEQTTRLEDFIELLKTLSSGSLKDCDDFRKYLERNAAMHHLKNFGFTVGIFSFNSPIPHRAARYFDVCQELLAEAKQNPDFLSDSTTAADIILQGLNAATEADGIAFTLRTILQPKQPRPTFPAAGIGS